MPNCRALLRANRELDAPVLRQVLAAVVGGDRPRCAEPDRLQPTRLHARLHQVGYHGLSALQRQRLIGIGAAFGAGMPSDLNVHAGARLGRRRKLIERREAGTLKLSTGVMKVNESAL